MPDSIASLIARIDERTERIEIELIAQNDRLSDYIGAVDKRCAAVDGHCREIAEGHGERIARLETRTGLLAVMAAGLSTIAGWLGVKY